MFDPLPPVLSWARSLYDESTVAVNVQREQMSALGQGAWVGIDLPEASFELDRFGDTPDGWDSSWTFEVHFGSGRLTESPEAAWGIVWAMAARMVRALTSNKGPEIPAAYLIEPVNFREDERWSEDDAASAQTIRTLTFQISRASAA